MNVSKHTKTGPALYQLTLRRKTPNAHHPIFLRVESVRKTTASTMNSISVVASMKPAVTVGNQMAGGI